MSPLNFRGAGCRIRSNQLLFPDRCTMVRPGKEPCEPPDDDHDDDTTQVTTEEGRWRAGVNRQSQPSAQEHQRAAGIASGAKRKQNAMSEEDRKAKDAERNKRNRAEQKAAREAAAAMRQMTLPQFNDVLKEAFLAEHPDSAGDFLEIERPEWQAFCAWVAREDEEQITLDNCMECYEAWSNPHGGPREEWERRRSTPPPTGEAAPVLPRAVAAAPAAPPAPDDDPDDPYGGGSADCFYEGPNDHDIAERQERLRHDQSGHEDHTDGYELDQERWYNDDAQRSAFYGVPAGDLPSSAAAPFGFVPSSGLPAAEHPAMSQPRREDKDVYGPLANNPEGDRMFRKDRALWYESVKGEPLTGTLTEQWEKADVLGRSFRVDNTRSGRP